ncbi:hypothetical protein [Asanoa iriomotensis]|uniref:Bacterial transcriptional activator domain-containing protein n=1 Tax=Asanoa iriomotensis TaxID=234613 RepID=A0ABQ4CFE4_9ACTN|nr:hypothetical protein [Asanoa iriomotensis]GIF61494.1 hypothetical protein Air01nite_75890 [Asanoa iriomotensis]
MIVSLEPELLEQLTRLDSPRNTAVAGQLDSNLAAAVRRTAMMRRLFYAAVLVVALYGTATGAVAAFDLPWWIAIGGIFALELGGVTFLSNADVRRRLGEHATASRLLGATIAAAAATFNVVTHGNRLLGGFYALMSVLGFVSWWLDVEAKRRDRLRARGLLPAPTPKYELLAHWTRHPLLTAQGRALAKAYPQLGLYGSLEAALIVRRRNRRDSALADALRSRIRTAAGKQMADIAVLTYDMDEVARRLRASADYDGLTALLGAELTAEHVLHGREDQAAVAARALLAKQTSAPLPLGGSTTHPQELAENNDPGAIAGPGTAAQPSIPVDRNGAAAPTTAWPAPSTTGDPFPATANGRPLLISPASRPGTLPARPSAARGVTVTLADSDSDRSTSIDGHAGRLDGPPPRPPIGTSFAAPAPGQPPDNRVRITVIGEPAILDTAGQPIRGLRAKSMELLVFLIVRRDGAPLSEIIASVWPDVTAQKANQRLSTCLSNLRSIIRTVRETSDPAEHGETAENPRPEPIVNTGGHYHLDPTIVAVDWWHLLDEHHAGAAEAADATVAAARARIADGYDYPWLDTDADGPSAAPPDTSWEHK